MEDWAVTVSLTVIDGVGEECFISVVAGVCVCADGHERGWKARRQETGSAGRQTAEDERDRQGSETERIGLAVFMGEKWTAHCDSGACSYVK